MNSMNEHDAGGVGTRPIVFAELEDVTIPGSIRKFFLRFFECSTSERSRIEAMLKDKGVNMMGVQGQDSLGLIFPGSWAASDSCRSYLESIGVKVETPRGCDLGQIAGILLRYR